MKYSFLGGSQKRCTKGGDHVRDCITHLLSIKQLNVDDFQVSGYRNIIVSCIYRSPGSDVTVFSEHVSEQLFLDLSLHLKSIFLCGDFNIDILKHNSNRGIKYFLDTTYAIGK